MTFSAERFREVAGAFPSGVTVVTGVDAGGPTGFTCQSFHALSLDPPMVVFAVAHTSTSWPRISPTGRCCVNVLSEAQEEVARSFAISGGEKFATHPWVPSADGCPILDGVVAWFGCTISAVHPGGDHDVVTADVRELGATDEAPLLFLRGRYTSLGSTDAA